jgi:hypothetical protein
MNNIIKISPIYLIVFKIVCILNIFELKIIKLNPPNILILISLFTKLLLNKLEQSFHSLAIWISNRKSWDIDMFYLK